MDIIERILKENEGGVAPAAVNSMGASSSTAGTGGIDTIDPLLMKNKKKPLRSIIMKRKAV